MVECHLWAPCDTPTCINRPIAGLGHYFTYQHMMLASISAWPLPFLFWDAGMAQWWERSAPTNVAQVRFPHLASLHVGWVCWFSTLRQEVFLSYSRFPLSSKTNIWLDLNSLLISVYTQLCPQFVLHCAYTCRKTSSIPFLSFQIQGKYYVVQNKPVNSVATKENKKSASKWSLQCCRTVSQN